MTVALRNEMRITYIINAIIFNRINKLRFFKIRETLRDTCFSCKILNI